MLNRILLAVLSFNILACAKTDFGSAGNPDFSTNPLSTATDGRANISESGPGSEPVNERHLCLAKWADYTSNMNFVMTSIEENYSLADCRTLAFNQSMEGVPGPRSNIDFYYIGESRLSGPATETASYIMSHFSPVEQYRP